MHITTNIIVKNSFVKIKKAIFNMEDLKIKNVNEVYFATTTEYEITYKGNDYTLRRFEDSNGGETLIFKGDEWQDLYEDSHGEIENEILDLIWDGVLD